MITEKACLAAICSCRPGRQSGYLEGYRMKNRVVVSIGGCPYTILADESEEYVKKISAYVNGKISEITSGSRIPSLDATVLAALNVGDEYFKALELNDSLRAQLKASIDENAKLKSQIAELRRASARYEKGS
jgi:cell division protein ZapA